MPQLSKFGVHFPALSPFFHSLISCIDHDDFVPFVNRLLAAARGLLPEDEKEEKCPRGYKTGQEQPPPQALRFSQGRGERLVMSRKGPPSFARARETSGYEAGTGIRLRQLPANVTDVNNTRCSTFD